MSSFLVLPSCETGRGGGHLFRSIALVKSLRAGGADAWLYAEQAEIFRNSSCSPKDFWLDKETILNKNWTLIILDRFRTKQDKVQYWAALAPVLGIDEGLSRECCDFLIDLLPGIPSNKAGEKANLCTPSLLPLPENRRDSFKTNNTAAGNSKDQVTILVSFGAEDAAGLTVETALAVKEFAGQETGIAAYSTITVSAALGPLRKNNEADRKTLEQAGIAVIEGKDLKEMLAGYDLIITHFGLTAFEALYARVPVLLINPSAYHEELSRNAGLQFVNFSYRGTEITEGTEEKKKKKTCPPPCSPSLRVSVRKKMKTDEFDSFYQKCAAQSEKAARRWGLENDNWAQQKYKTLSDMLMAANPAVHRHCPLCGAPAGKITGRFPERTYRLCPCGTITMDRLGAAPTEYNQNYFFNDYKKQYGKTYLEDFPKLQEDGSRRLHFIDSVLFNTFFKKNISRKDAESQSNKRNLQTMQHSLRLSALARKKRKENPPHKDVVCGQTKARRLLDIGCAYGPFLAAAKNEGFEVYGIDPSADAVGYVKKTLGISATEGTFPDALPELIKEAGNKLYDVITLWYVIEHFKEPGEILAITNRLLKNGGILAFSTPSAAGVSRRKSLERFLENSPADHWTIWDPRHVKNILSRYGFKLRKRIITGHHPERFPFAKNPQAPMGGRFFLALSRFFNLGDTFEAYAVKVRNYDNA